MDLFKKQTYINTTVLREVREKAGYSIDDMWHEVKYYELYEGGQRMPSADVLFKIAQLFNVPVGCFFLKTDQYREKFKD